MLRLSFWCFVVRILIIEYFEMYITAQYCNVWHIINDICCTLHICGNADARLRFWSWCLVKILCLNFDQDWCDVNYKQLLWWKHPNLESDMAMAMLINNRHNKHIHWWGVLATLHRYQICHALCKQRTLKEKFLDIVQRKNIEMRQRETGAVLLKFMSE